jgi:aryl-alcohol dehydrogenase
VLESRLSIARQLGATHTVLAGSGTKTAEEIRKLVPGGVGYAFDTTGRAESNQQAIESLAAKGFFGFCATPAEAPKMSTIMIRGLTIRGIVQGDSVPDSFIPRLIELHMNGRFPFDKMVTRYPFEKINQAIEDQAAGKVVKPVFTFPS